jgi:Protein of unknown function (DUF3147)
MFPVRSNANFARLPRGISTAICTSPSSVKGGKLGHGERPIDLAVRRRRRRTDAQDKRYLSKISTGETMLEYGLRFLIGGIAVSVFAALGDSLRPKSFAGLFGAAPSIALATLFITLSKDGASFAAIEGRSMMVGAFALAAYSWVVCMLLKRFTMSSWTAATSALVVWFAVAFVLCVVLFGLP